MMVVLDFLKMLRVAWKEESYLEPLSSIELVALSRKIVEKQIPPELRDEVYNFLNKAIKSRVKKKIILNPKEPFGDLECFNIKWLEKQIVKQERNR